MQYADVFDRATEFEAMERAEALAKHERSARRSGPPPEVVDGVACCAACGEPIPAARLAALPGIGLCVGCQQKAEGGSRG